MRKANFIHPSAVIGDNVDLGEGNYIGPLCIIGYPAEHRKYWGKPLGTVVIGNNNIFTGLVTIDAGTEKETIIGNNNMFLKHSHVGHDAVVGNNVTVSCGAKIGGHAVINNKVNIGLNACIHQFVVVAEGVMIGMCAAVTKKLLIEPYRKYAGVPAKDIGSNEQAKNNS
jgi:UDP-N-acetylglucosamine acyltransferase